MKRKIIPYNPELKILARQLRNNSTKSEIILWNQIKNKSLGYRFTRQKPLNKYIVDFFCYELMLAIEIDGYSHLVDAIVEKDIIKTNMLNKLGIQVFRIEDKEIFHNLENTILALQNLIKQIENTPLTPLRGELLSEYILCK